MAKYIPLIRGKLKKKILIGHIFLAKFFFIQTFLDHTLFGQKLFFGPKVLSDLNFLDLYLFGPIFFGKKLFWTHLIFRKQNILYQKFAGHKTFWNQNFLKQIFIQIPNLSLYVYLYGSCIAPLFSFFYIGFQHKIFVHVYLYHPRDPTLPPL